MQGNKGSETTVGPFGELVTESRMGSGQAGLQLGEEGARAHLWLNPRPMEVLWCLS